jgi:transcription termination/antitermination protein NusA
MGGLTEEQVEHIVEQAERKAEEAERAAAEQRRRQKEQDQLGGRRSRTASEPPAPDERLERHAFGRSAPFAILGPIGSSEKFPREVVVRFRVIAMGRTAEMN